MPSLSFGVHHHNIYALVETVRLRPVPPSNSSHLRAW